MTRLCCPRAGQNKPCNIGISIWSHVTPVASLRLPACARHHGFQTAAMQAEAIHQYLGKGDHTHARNQVSAHPLPRAHAESSARGEGDPLRKRGGGGKVLMEQGGPQSSCSKSKWQRAVPILRHVKVSWREESGGG